jgi:glycosyltransferase involved in cell wall biosynthesis
VSRSESGSESRFELRSGARSEGRPAGAPSGPVGYVLKVYPRFSETFVVNEIIAREAAGERVEIVSLRPPGDPRFHSRLADVQAPVTWIPGAGRSADRLWTLLREARAELPALDHLVPDLLAHDLDDAAQAIEVARWARARGIEHLHAHFATVATTVARLASLLTGIPYSFTAHAKDVFHESVDDEDLRRKLRDADHAITVSDFNLAHLRQRFPAETRRLHRVYNGLDLTDVPVRTTDPVEPSIVAVGRFVEKKGFADLIDAVAVLRDRGVRLPLRLAGCGRLEAALRDQVVASGLDDLVTFLGPLPQHTIHGLVAGATVFAAPCIVAADGDRDGLPTVLLEAMAIGTPVVSTPVTGIPEIVVDGVTGLLVPEGDPYALATALQRLVDEPALGPRLAAAARTRIEEDFDVRGQARSLAGLRRAASGPAMAHWSDVRAGQVAS